jgi:ACS family tartrate transporter-like MFS transporter
VAEAGFFPGMILYLTYWFPPRYYGSAVARFMTAIPLAGLIGSALAAWALAQGHFGLSGWMWLFIVTGVPAVVLGLLVLFFLPDSPDRARFLSTEEKSRLRIMVSPEVTSDGGRNGGTEQSGGFFLTLADLTVWRFALLYFTLTLSMYGFQLWLPQLIKAFAARSDTMTAILSAIPAIFQALGMLVIAGNSDRTGERRYHVVAATVFTCSGLVLSCLTVPVWVKMAGLCLAAFGIWGSVGPFWALTTNSLPRLSQATGIAVINSVGNLGGFAGPFIFGYIKQHLADFNYSLIALAVSSVVAGLLSASSPPSPGRGEKNEDA